ncbi:unnamed protein product [Brassica oleracea]
MIFVIDLVLKIKKKEKKDTVEVNPSREFLWQGHTAHATKEDANKEVTLVFEALDHYRIYEEYFAVPVVKDM